MYSCKYPKEYLESLTLLQLKMLTIDYIDDEIKYEDNMMTIDEYLKESQALHTHYEDKKNSSTHFLHLLPGLRQAEKEIKKYIKDIELVYSLGAIISSKNMLVWLQATIERVEKGENPDSSAECMTEKKPPQKQPEATLEGSLVLVIS